MIKKSCWKPVAVKQGWCTIFTNLQNTCLLLHSDNELESLMLGWIFWSRTYSEWDIFVFSLKTLLSSRACKDYDIHPKCSEVMRLQHFCVARRRPHIKVVNIYKHNIHEMIPWLFPLFHPSVLVFVDDKTLKTYLFISLWNCIEPTQTASKRFWR